MTTKRVKIGVAGWSYPDWKGIVYPRKTYKDFHPLSYLAKVFDLIEVDSTFYKIPEPFTVYEWTRLTSDFKDFKFSLKLYEGFTHRHNFTIIDEKNFKKAIEPLLKANKFFALLIQLPWSFRNIEENRRYLSDLLERFLDYPKAVELRHNSWEKIEILTFLREKNATFCNIDQPIFAHSTGNTAAVGEKISYFRFHGRNSAKWFREGVTRDERYDYLYKKDELLPFVEVVKELSPLSIETGVIFNNHFKGKAVVNAFEFAFLLNGEKQKIFDELLINYPHLSQISLKPLQKSLFVADDENFYE